MSEKGNIVWLASYPKSGNTWFRVILHNLLEGPDKPVDINELDRTGIASSRSLFDQVSGVGSSDLSSDEIDLIRPDIYRQLSAQSKEAVYMKVHDAWTRNAKDLPLFPEEATRSVIYIIRNPLDVAVSLSFHNGEKAEESLKKLNDPDYGLCLGKKRLFNQLPQNLLSWSEHVRSWTRNSGLNVHVLRYEDLHDHPLETIERALAFLNLDFERTAIEQAIANSSLESLKQQEKEAGFSEKPLKAESFFRKGVKSDWLNHLDKDLASSFLDSNKEIFSLFYTVNYNAD